MAVLKKNTYLRKLGNSYGVLITNAELDALRIPKNKRAKLRVQIILTPLS